MTIDLDAIDARVAAMRERYAAQRFYVDDDLDLPDLIADLAAEVRRLRVEREARRRKDAHRPFSR